MLYSSEPADKDIVFFYQEAIYMVQLYNLRKVKKKRVIQNSILNILILLLIRFLIGCPFSICLLHFKASSKYRKSKENNSFTRAIEIKKMYSYIYKKRLIDLSSPLYKLYLQIELIHENIFTTKNKQINQKKNVYNRECSD